MRRSPVLGADVVAVPPAVVQCCAEGREAFFAGRLGEACCAYAKAVRLWEVAGRPDPDGTTGSTLYECLGLALFNRRRWSAAACCFQRALDGDRQSREQSLRFLVTALVRMGHLGHARARLRSYERRHGAHPDGWTGPGLTDLHAAARARRARQLPG